MNKKIFLIASFVLMAFIIIAGCCNPANGEMLDGYYTPTTEDERSAGTRNYYGKDDVLYEFDITDANLKPYGFLVDDKVMTPMGPAHVIGLHKSNLWFHVQGDKGGSYWENFLREEFVEKKFRVLKSADYNRKKPKDEYNSDEKIDEKLDSRDNASDDIDPIQRIINNSPRDIDIPKIPSIPSIQK